MAGSFLESFFQIAAETTYGTAETTGFIRYPILTFEPSVAYDIYESGQVSGAAGEQAPAFGVKRATFRTTFEASYAMDSGLYAVLGAKATSGVADPWTNNYTPSATLPSFTVHAGIGDVPTGKVYRFVGCVANRWEFNFDAAQGFATVSIDWIAQNEDSTNPAGLTAVAATQTIVHEPIQITPSTYVANVDIGIGASLAYCVRSGSVAIDRFLTTSRICLGSDTIKQPVPTKPMKVEANFNYEFTDRLAYNALLDKTVHTTTRLGWDGGTHSFNLYIPKGVYTAGGLPPVQQGDYLVAPLTLKGYGTSGTTTTAEPINFAVESIIDGATL